MENKEFCHLHLHSTFSKLDGFGYPKEYANKAKKMGFEYLACTDHGNIDGLIKFQTGCKEEDIKPIFGCEAYMVENYESKEKPGHVSIWVKNEIGFKNLCRILSIANLVGFNKKPRISFQDFYDHVDGLVVGTACVQSFVNLKNGKAFFRKLKKRLGSDLYVEIMPNDMSLQKDHNQAMVKLSHRTKTKIIATNDCHYIKRSDNKLQEMLLAIQSKKTWNDPKRWKFDITGLYLKSAKEMEASLNQIGFYKKEYLSNTIEIAKKCCGFSIPKREIDLPRVPGVPINPIEAKRMLLSLCKKGFEKKFGHKIEKNKIYHERLKEEHDLIARKNFERYFFIVWELCEWCKKQEILIGPGRGSVGGSLIAYLLGITSVDPIKHNLFFSRFISEDRIDYPDIDLDFEDRKRHLIKQHLESVYGEGHVAGVSSFSRLQARAAIQDVARVFEVPPGEVNHFTKLIDETSNDPVSEKIETATQFPDGQLFANKYPKVIRIAKKIGGQIRGYSQHAAALVISKDDISEGGRCNLIERNEARLINWEKDDAEYMGLMKLDALGLKLLSILSHCLKLIKDNHQKAISLEKINLEDKEVLSQIGQGNNVGVFQLNTWAMSSLAKDIGIKSFNEIVDTIALVRPGPMASGMTKEYIKRKNGLSWERMHPIYEELTKDTFGLLVYQEQVMNVISKVAGLPYSTADKIRKIIGKKRDKKEFEKYEKIFKSGCKKKKTLSPQEADDFWTGLQEWVRYGFGLSHSVEYAILGYWCAWLKHYFPSEFICASLTFGDETKKPELVEEAYKLGLSIILPKVGKSDAFEWMAKNSCLHIPFAEVKTIGKVKATQAAESFKTKSKADSFFKSSKTEQPQQIKGKFGELLNKIGAYQEANPELTEEIKNLFKFRIVTSPRTEYQRLYKLTGDISLKDLDSLLSGSSQHIKKLQVKPKRLSFSGNRDLINCELCELVKECQAPVLPSKGKLNIAIVGEAPGPQEDEQKEGFVGKSGEKVWKQLKKWGYERELFHISNVAKCYPSKSRKPNSKQIQLCGKTYLDKELREIKPIVILAFGNTSLEFFKDQKTGIMSMSGQVAWNEKYGAWIVYCLHPAATLHNPDNESYYLSGMRSFRKLLKSINLKKTS